MLQCGAHGTETTHKQKCSLHLCIMHELRAEAEAVVHVSHKAHSAVRRHVSLDLLKGLCGAVAVGRQRRRLRALPFGISAPR